MRVTQLQQVLPADDAEAEARFARTRAADPFPKIPPALLNTSDLLDYVVATGMMHPFSVNSEKVTEFLKPASCAVRVAGPYVLWRGTGLGQEPDPPEEGVLGTGDRLVLGRNSIVYVTLEPIFRLPDYIAGRFNLTIRDVYRGLLVGTGPLVDPGFQGRLSIPLHNPTANQYTLKGGDPLLWMEFTKLSPHADWARPVPKGTLPKRRGFYVAFAKRKLDRRSVRDYVDRAHDGEPIRSSVPELIGQAARDASDAQQAAQRVSRTFQFVSAGALAALVIALAALYFQVTGLVQDAQRKADSSARQNDALKKEFRSLKQSGKSAK